eukprot:TRINITY_DN177_c1_g1_i4.p2 TRINITY_DN177_c1_g1~~TRINITY_DN177_c1_g1_i4.p2  ORF type:complete len:156 (-),score=24.15 TRINITY_DN177_c1_g1_i4:125-592(-)
MMQATVSFTKLSLPCKLQSHPRRSSPVIMAGLKQDATSLLKAGVIGAASTAIAFQANALDIKMGADDGSLVFVPAKASVKSGETITWINNKGFPHNIIFDEDEVPSGVDADAISQEEYLNAPGETHVVKLTTAGTYNYYCQPHQGAGMAGSITVE